jgi:hypothetical protein
MLKSTFKIHMAVLPFGNSSVGQEDFVGHDCKSNFDFVGIRLG